MFVTDYTPEDVALDVAHNLFISSSVLAAKPQHVLELGIGSGRLTKSILTALRFNQCGTLLCVDSWIDNAGKEPALAAELKWDGALIENCTEQKFVEKCSTDRFDMLISDADHTFSQCWLHHHLRIVKPNGFLFFHDTNNSLFPNLKQILKQTVHLPHFHFVKNSRADERCDRGLLFVINKK